MPNLKTSNLKGPWYKNWVHWNNLACKYMQAYLALPKDAKQHSEFEMFSDLCRIRLVFESNLIEEAGLPFGDTKKLVQEHFPQIPNNYNLFKRAFAQQGKKRVVSVNLKAQLEQMVDAISKFGNAKQNLQPRFCLGAGATREAREVFQHYIGIVMTEKVALKYLYSKLLLQKANSLREKHTDETELKSAWDKIVPNEPIPTVAEKLFSEDWIKEIHKEIAEDLLPSDAKVRAGEYRIDARSVGFDVAFPSPELVPDCMRKFVIDSNKLIDEAIPHKTNPFDVAARISYDFVRIHPFPDFNGRMSRLILMVTLQAFSVPFAFTLRGSKKHKDRYGYSLRRANRGEIRPYAALIAMRLAETFQEIDENLLIAGLDPLISIAD